MTKSERFNDITNIKVFLICGAINPGTRLAVCEKRISKVCDEESEDISVSLHGAYGHTDLDRDFFKGQFIDFYGHMEYSLYARRSKLTTKDSWDFSLVCNGQAFSVSKLKRIINQTESECYIHCTSSSIKTLYHDLSMYKIRAIDWNNPDSFTEDILQNEFLGSLELKMSTEPKSNDNYLQDFLSLGCAY